MTDLADLTGIEFKPDGCMVAGCGEPLLCFGLCAVHVGVVFPTPHSGQGNWRSVPDGSQSSFDRIRSRKGASPGLGPRLASHLSDIGGRRLL